MPLCTWLTPEYPEAPTARAKARPRKLSAKSRVRIVQRILFLPLAKFPSCDYSSSLLIELADRAGLSQKRRDLFANLIGRERLSDVPARAAGKCLADAAPSRFRGG